VTADAPWTGVAPATAPTIPGLEIVAEIGRGANAKVHLARRNGADYAVKIQEATTSDDQALAAFHRRRPCWRPSATQACPGSTRWDEAPAVPTWSWTWCPAAASPTSWARYRAKAAGRNLVRAG
jgi:hypothetical protein